jgi:hypothetical protein
MWALLVKWQFTPTKGLLSSVATFGIRAKTILLKRQITKSNAIPTLGAFQESALKSSLESEPMFQRRVACQRWLAVEKWAWIATLWQKERLNKMFCNSAQSMLAKNMA